MTKSPWLAVFSRNPDGWWASVKLAARSLFYAPSSAWWMAGDAMKSSAVGLIALPVALLAWLLLVITQVAAGLAGFLSEHPTNKEGK